MPKYALATAIYLATDFEKLSKSPLDFFPFENCLFWLWLISKFMFFLIEFILIDSFICKFNYTKFFFIVVDG